MATVLVIFLAAAVGVGMLDAAAHEWRDRHRFVAAWFALVGAAAVVGASFLLAA